MAAARCSQVPHSRFAARRSTPRRMLLAGVTAWSLSTTACVPAYARYEEPTPSLAGRDSLAQAYDLGVRDANKVLRAPASGVRLLLPLAAAALTLAGFALAVATKRLWVAAALPVAASLGVTIKTGIDASHPPPPPDSAMATYGIRSPEMWGNYVNGYSDTIDARHQTAFHASVIGFVLIAITEAFVLLILSALKLALTHV